MTSLDHPLEACEVSRRQAQVMRARMLANADELARIIARSKRIVSLSRSLCDEPHLRMDLMGTPEQDAAFARLQSW